MNKRLLYKFSAALLRAHRYLDLRLKMGVEFRPRVVRYPERIGDRTIVHVIGNFIVGGSSQLVVDIVEGTSDLYRHKIVVPNVEPQLAYQPVDIHAFSISELRELREWFIRERPELVHVHYFVRESDLYSEGALWYETVFRICEELNLAVIQNVNVPTSPYSSPTILRNVFVSEWVRREFNNVDTGSSVIYPGSDFTHFRNEESYELPDKSIGMVYRLDNDKLRADAIEVFISTAKKDPQLKAYIIGGGQFLEDYVSRVREEQLESRLLFPGFVSYDALPDAYKKFSIFVAPVHDESFGQVTPFAMGMGQCVVGYDTGALSEILGNRDTLVPTGDVDALSDLIASLLRDPEKRRSIGRRNRERAIRNFSTEQMVIHYRQLYEAVRTQATLAA